jgi:hypothetical protein
MESISKLVSDSLARHGMEPILDHLRLAWSRWFRCDGRLFLPGNRLLGKLNSGRCFARYAVIEDASQRSAAYAVFQRWMQDSADTASGIREQPCDSDISVRADRQQSFSADTPVRAAETENQPDADVHAAVPPSISSAWGAGFLEVQNRETDWTLRRPAPLPSGF